MHADCRHTDKGEGQNIARRSKVKMFQMLRISKIINNHLICKFKAQDHFQNDNITHLNALTAVIQLPSLDGRRPRQTRSATPCDQANNLAHKNLLYYKVKLDHVLRDKAKYVLWGL